MVCGGLQNVMTLIRLLYGRKRAGVPRQVVIGRSKNKKLEVYQGYTEQPIRCICEIEDENAEAKTVETIMPDGHVEMESKFKPEKGRALVTFGHSQYISKHLASKFVRRDDGCPFIHDEDKANSEAYPLAQTWTVNLNKRFYETFEQIDELTVSGYRTFKECMKKLFTSSELDKYPIRCYRMRREQVNPELVFVGPRDLMAVFLEDVDTQKYFSISANQYGFTSWFVPKGKWFPRAKTFVWPDDMEEEVVLFTREGNSSMTVMVNKQQFILEKQFGEKV
mmetsp:Transcript_54794/g.105762  ORF Transcript_54794/g.105762 Transcript_54794/m.105762 type:complete len:279 (-) Transcript_54794:209-1045(-)